MGSERADITHRRSRLPKSGWMHLKYHIRLHSLGKPAQWRIRVDRISYSPVFRRRLGFLLAHRLLNGCQSRSGSQPESCCPPSNASFVLLSMSIMPCRYGKKGPGSGAEKPGFLSFPAFYSRPAPLSAPHVTAGFKRNLNVFLVQAE